ncbi:MAG: sodium-extruding oxaloacetate decarboxylase subunit alpha [Pseudomonadota bacterium]|nr:sodium-extruding oxaloacetate decarboxylase subunit alpha [Pseudomonadota bacterium]
MSKIEQKSKMKNKLGLTELVLRDAHQSLFATRMRTDDMLPIASKLDDIGFWSIESWGGATFDACIRFLGEDPWERIRQLKKAMPKTPQQMLFRGQNILGYRHYADDVVTKFVERAATNGVDIFRIFDALNDLRNLESSIKAVVKMGKHAQGTISYTVSPVHTIDLWVSLAQQIQDMGAHSLCIKDMAGLLKPYVAYDLVSRLKEKLSIPIHMQSHATTGLSTATYLKSIEAGIDNVDTAVSSMSMTYGHSPTESLVSILENTGRDTGLNIQLIEEISDYFKKIRKKYEKFEGSLKGVDSRILVAQVPGGMLTNLENQLREQSASNKLDEVLSEIPRVREDLGNIPLVTPTSQIVGSQAVLNVMLGRYNKLSKETEGILKGEYGATPSPVNSSLQAKVLGGAEPITCRPADLLEPELEKIKTELLKEKAQNNFDLSTDIIDDILTYALFPQVALYFFKNRKDLTAFEPIPDTKSKDSTNTINPIDNNQNQSKYNIKVNGRIFEVEVMDNFELKVETPKNIKNAKESTEATIDCPLSGTITNIKCKVGDKIRSGQVILVLEAMKMETEVVAEENLEILQIPVAVGDKVTQGQALIKFKKEN